MMSVEAEVVRDRAIDCMLDGKPVTVSREEFKDAYRAGIVKFSFTDGLGVQRGPTIDGVMVVVEGSKVFR